jgi:hypothetical protein
MGGTLPSPKGPQVNSNPAVRSAAPASVVPQASSSAQAPAPSDSRFKQTILRHELDSFLLMASLSLVRKLYSFTKCKITNATFSFTIQGIQCGYTHHNSLIVNVAVGLKDAFVKTLDVIRPIGSGRTPQDDIFELDLIVDLFKKYVYNNGNDLRSKVQSPDSKQIAQAYRYEVAFHKSAHHIKMENNHAVIEDLNAFAKLPSNAPQTSFYGVFDGHGGYMVSEYLSLHMAANIARHPAFLRSMTETFRGSFAKTDEDVVRKVERDVPNFIYSYHLMICVVSSWWINCCHCDCAR